MIRTYIINSTILNLFVKALNYGYYLLVTIYIGYGLQTDAIFYIDGILAFTLLLPLSFFNLTLVPKLTKEIERFNINFSTIIILSFLWSILWIIIFSILLKEIFHIFYPGLSKSYMMFIENNKLYINIFILFSLVNNFMSMTLDVLKKHTLVYKILSVKSIASLIILYLYKDLQEVLFIVLAFASLVEFLLYIFFYKKYIIFALNIKFIIEQFKDIKYVALFVSVGMLFGVIDRYFISYLEQSSITILKYSTLIVGIISSLVPLSRILYPYLSQFTKEKQLDLFYKALKIILFIYIPILIFIYIFPTFIPKLLFGYGKIDSNQIEQMGFLLLFLVPTTIFGLIIGILDKILFLQKLYKALFYRLIATIVINGVGNYLSVFVFDWKLNGIVFFTTILHFYILVSSYFIIKGNINV